ncbi:MAG TPA: ABC transporter ATP-binding protein [Bryobacteraceae bacterium]|nr:ABC transporter ATP-binding protein [Bryobacteraceae bacterium]
MEPTLRASENQHFGPLLQVRHLTIEQRGLGKPVLDHISFDLHPGEAVGVLGNSGVGKTTLTRAILRVLPSALRVTGGTVLFRGNDLLCATARQLRQIRGAQISLIHQEPELVLNPVIRVGEQVVEVLRAHVKLDRRKLRTEAQAMLDAIGLPGSDFYFAYPHQLSGGQRQRVVIAQALVSKPALLIADEPTSALDNVAQAAILGLLKDSKRRYGLAVMFVTHNPVLLSGLVDRVVVINEGRIVENRTFDQICWEPSHPYTKELWRAIPPVAQLSDRRSQPPPVSGAKPCPPAGDTSEGLLLDIRALKKSYNRRDSSVIALDGVEFSLRSSSKTALVGRSGCGKSTLARCMIRLVEPDSGEIWFSGRDVLALGRRELANVRPKIQLIFQQSSVSLNPRFNSLQVVEEPLRVHRVSKTERRARALGIMARLGIPPEWADRHPLELSGGQRQRLALARALILEPSLLILDEAVCGLDASVQKQIADLLIELQRSFSLSYLYISHDLRMAAYLADDIAVMHQGRIVERASVDKLFSDPQHPETHELIRSIPRVSECSTVSI